MKLKFTAIMISLGLLCASAPTSAATTNTNVVVYKGGQVTKAEFATFEGINRLFNPYYDQLASVDQNYRTKIAKQLVALEVLSAKVDKATLTKLSKRAATELSSIRTDATTQLGGKKQYQKLLADLKITEADLKTYLIRSDFVTDYFKKNLTEKEIKAKYNAMAKDNQFVIANVRHLLVMTTDPSTSKEIRSEKEALKKANAYKKQLDAGADFAKLATKYTDDPGSKSTGGLYAGADVNGWVPEFKKAVLTQAINKIGKPVKTSYGYHIIRVEKRTNKKLTQVRSTVEGALYQEKLQSYVNKEATQLIRTLNIPK